MSKLDFMIAVQMWQAGCDSLDIARAVGVHQSIICHNLQNIRDAARQNNVAS